jgi:hypothetical protein
MRFEPSVKQSGHFILIRIMGEPVMGLLRDSAQSQIPRDSVSVTWEILFSLYLVVGLAVLLLPTWVALWRRRPGAGRILLVNLFLSWTVVGWVLALIFAFRDPGRKVREPYICRNCYTVSMPRFRPKPWLFGHGRVAPELNCPRCNAQNPVPLDTPAGREIANMTGLSIS